ALRCRREHPGLFTDGGYLPIDVAGTQQGSVFSFLRQHGDQEAVVCVPRMLTRVLHSEEALPLGAGTWGDTVLQLPREAHAGGWVNVFTREKLTASAGERSTLAVADVLAHFPVAVLVSQPEDR